MLENARKRVVPLVLMNRYINQSRCETYILSVEFDVWYKKGSVLLRTCILKVKATNTYVLNSRCIQIQQIPYDINQEKSRDIQHPTSYEESEFCV